MTWAQSWRINGSASGILSADDLEVHIPFDRQIEIGKLSVDFNGDGLLGEALADRGSHVEAGGWPGVRACATIRQSNDDSMIVRTVGAGMRTTRHGSTL